MGYKRLFLDSDVILDLLLKREPFSIYTQLILNQSKSEDFELNTSPLIFANVNYILSKKIGGTLAREGLKTFARLINILNFDGDIIEMALNSRFADFEDSIEYYIAERYKCDLIITRNTKDYKHSTIPVLTPEQFLKTL
jgi:predicted nucleic acid-binding protein